MNDTILILEPSATLREVFSSNIPKENYSLLFKNDFSDFYAEVSKAHEKGIKAVLLNAEFKNPSAFDIAALVKSLERMKKIPLGIYSTDFSYDERFVTGYSSTDLYFTLSKETILEKIQSLVSIADSGLTALPPQISSVKNALIHSLYGMIQSWETSLASATNFINLLVDFCHVPAAALFLNQKSGVHAYYLCAENFLEKDTLNFLKVSSVDFFETLHLPVNERYAVQQVASRHSLEKFYEPGIVLSSYQSVMLFDSKRKAFGSVHIIRQGNFTGDQLNVLYYATEKAGLIF